LVLSVQPLAHQLLFVLRQHGPDLGLALETRRDGVTNGLVALTPA
jgi:hypothetical protein